MLYCNSNVIHRNNSLISKTIIIHLFKGKCMGTKGMPVAMPIPGTKPLSPWLSLIIRTQDQLSRLLYVPNQFRNWPQISHPKAISSAPSKEVTAHVWKCLPWGAVGILQRNRYCTCRDIIRVSVCSRSLSLDDNLKASPWPKQKYMRKWTNRPVESLAEQCPWQTGPDDFWKIWISWKRGRRRPGTAMCRHVLQSPWCVTKRS